MSDLQYPSEFEYRGGELPTDSEPTPEHHLVPGWLVILVLALVLAVGGVAVAVMGGFWGSDEQLTISEREIAELRVFVEGAPDDTDARLALAYALQTDGQLEAALAEYRTVIDLRPADVGAHYNIGLILLEQGQVDAAEESLREVLSTSPEHPLAAKALGSLYADQKRYEDVIEFVGPASTANPMLADLHFLLGFANEQLDRDDVAREEYAAALEFDPDMAEAEAGLGRLGASE